MDSDLEELLTQARKRVVSDEERERQRISFAYGNSKIENDAITRETVVRESERLRRTDAGSES